MAREPKAATRKYARPKPERVAFSRLTTNGLPVALARALDELMAACAPQAGWSEKPVRGPPEFVTASDVARDNPVIDRVQAAQDLLDVLLCVHHVLFDEMARARPLKEELSALKQLNLLAVRIRRDEGRLRKWHDEYRLAAGLRAALALNRKDEDAAVREALVAHFPRKDTAFIAKMVRTVKTARAKSKGRGDPVADVIGEAVLGAARKTLENRMREPQIEHERRLGLLLNREVFRLPEDLWQGSEVLARSRLGGIGRHAGRAAEDLVQEVAASLPGSARSVARPPGAEVLWPPALVSELVARLEKLGAAMGATGPSEPETNLSERGGPAPRAQDGARRRRRGPVA